MEEVLAQCGHPLVRGRLKKRTDTYSLVSFFLAKLHLVSDMTYCV